MTPRQKDLIDVIKRLTVDGVPPTYGEMSQAMGTGKGNIHRILHDLRDLGLVDFNPGHHRTVHVVEPGHSMRFHSTARLLEMRAEIDALLLTRMGGPFEIRGGQAA